MIEAIGVTVWFFFMMGLALYLFARYWNNL